MVKRKLGYWKLKAGSKIYINANQKVRNEEDELGSRDRRQGLETGDRSRLKRF